METMIGGKAPTSIHQISFQPYGGNAHPSPADWRDQVFYFLLPDRFSNGLESDANKFDMTHPELYQAPDKKVWMEGGKLFQGGNLKGVKNQLGYLRDLGITAIWLGPILKQRRDDKIKDSYHGYAPQNFLDVDPSFGTREDLRRLVDDAHGKGMYVIMDIILNHTGNNWYYTVDGNAKETVGYRHQPPYDFFGWRSEKGEPMHSTFGPDDAVWPEEFRDPGWYNRAGSISHWDPASWEDPMHPEAEFRRGDFGTLKDLDLDSRQDALSAIIDVYKYWIALCDVDGYRIDTVKHVSFESCKNFSGAIHEYAESIGKENFFLIGEVTGGAQMARDYLSIFGRNIDAVLDIGQAAENLTGMVKGFLPASQFFEQFQGHDKLLGGHRETGRYHLSILDDHDFVGRKKARFAAGGTASKYIQTAHAVGAMLTTLGIPCLYYGTEQAFAGSVDDHDKTVDPAGGYEDRYVRETMFGGTFGAFGTQGCHFFNQEHPTYLRIAAISGVRNRQDHIGLALRRGRQYQRETKGDREAGFYIHGAGQLTAWSRIQDHQEVLVVLNTNGASDMAAHVTVHEPFHRKMNTGKTTMQVLYDSSWSDEQLKNPPAQSVEVEYFENDRRAAVHVSLKAAGMMILASPAQF